MANHSHHHLDAIFQKFAAGAIIARNIDCNDTCCKNSEDEILCFVKFNYTDRFNLTYTEPWELGVRWTYTILVTLVAVLGNLCVIIILLKNRLLLRTSVNQFILNMSVADLILAIAGPIPFTIRDTQTFWPLGKVWCHLEGYTQMLVMLVSVASLATISFDRMLGIVRPFHQHLRRAKSLAIICIIWVSSALLAIPWGIYRMYTVHIWQDLTETICGEREEMHIWMIVGVIGLTWLPLTIMVGCYTTIFVYFHHTKFKSTARREHPVMTHLKKRVVKMMFLVVVVFTICWLPLQIFEITSSNFLNEDGQVEAMQQKLYDDLLTVCQYMIYVNPAVNPIVYAFLHQTFRRAFKVTFPWFYKRKSSLVLTPGQGRSRYTWSVRSSNGHVVNDSRVAKGRSVRNELNGRVSSLEPNYNKTETAGSADITNLSRKKNKSRCCFLRHEDCTTSNSNKKKNKKGHPILLRCDSCLNSKNKRKREHSLSRVSRKFDNSTDVGDAGDLVKCPATHTDEGYVTHLPPKKLSVLSSGALGHLITQVIEEENSSDVENERIL